MAGKHDFGWNSCRRGIWSGHVRLEWPAGRHPDCPPFVVSLDSIRPSCPAVRGMPLLLLAQSPRRPALGECRLLCFHSPRFFTVIE